jgi:hypothetical protein
MHNIFAPSNQICALTGELRTPKLRVLLRPVHFPATTMLAVFDRQTETDTKRRISLTHGYSEIVSGWEYITNLSCRRT